MLSTIVQRLNALDQPFSSTAKISITADLEVFLRNSQQMFYLKDRVTYAAV